MSRQAHSRELLGYERSLVVDEHLRWLRGRLPSEAVRESAAADTVADYPIAVWSRGHCHALAVRRSRVGWGSGNNRKRFDRRDDAPALIDEVTR